MSKFIANSFQVPNAFVDEMLDKISGNACKIYLLIVRKTRGWNKEADRISYTQIQKYTGINHRATISKAIDELLEMGLIIVAKGNEKSSNEYRLNDDFCSKNEQEHSSKNEPDKKCTSSKNEPASSKNEQEPSSKNEHTEIHIFKNTRIKNKSEYTHDEHTHENPKNSQKTKAKNTAEKIQKPDGLDEQIWRDFVKTKKQRTKSDLTVTAWNRFFGQVQLAQQKTSHSLNEIFSFWICDVTWQGFNCDWYTQRHTANKEQDYATRLFNEYNAKYGHQSAASTAPVGNVYDLETGVWHENE